MVNEVYLRALVPSDWPSVKAIYESGIATGMATFEQTAPTWQSWDSNHLPTCRWVAVKDTEVLVLPELSNGIIKCGYFVAIQGARRDNSGTM